VEVDAATGQAAASSPFGEADALAYLAAQEEAKGGDKLAMFSSPSSVAHTESQVRTVG
jgi:hypothetical protein